MIKKPDVLSENKLAGIYSDKNWYMFLPDLTRAGIIARIQRGADVEYYEPLIKEMSEALKARAYMEREDTPAYKGQLQEVQELELKALAKAEGK